jgi:ABC-type oligopeptide transport system substrate-binding subunit
MRKIALVAAATAALGLAACAEGTDDAELTADTELADTETNMDAMDAEMNELGAETEMMADDAMMGAEDAVIDAEAELEGETETEAALD